MQGINQIPKQLILMQGINQISKQLIKLQAHQQPFMTPPVKFHKK